MSKDIHNLKIAVLNIYSFLENKRLMSPAEQITAVEDVVALVGADNIKDADKKTILKDNIKFDVVVAKLKKQGRIE